MNNAHYRISLDIHSAESQIQLICRRGETGRTIRATLTQRGQPYEIGQNCFAELAARLPDGTMLKSACGISGSAISYKLTSRATSQSGILECELRLIDYSGELLVSPRFTLAVYDTVYNQGDAVIQEGPSAATVKSSESGYSQVFLWSDGNPLGENRLGCFVSADVNRSTAMITRANEESQILGVSAAIPGFAAGASQDKFDSSGALSWGYSYVTMLGFAPVRDLGRCTVNGRCCSDENGWAKPCSEGGFYVAERIDETTVTVLLTADGDLRTMLNQQLAKRENKLSWLTRQDIDAMLAGSYVSTEEEPVEAGTLLFAVREDL